MHTFMKTIVLALGVAFFCIGTLRADDVRQNEAQTKSVKILFIGNSYTYFNSLNVMVQEMMNVSGVPTVAERSAPGGWRLRQHFNGEVPQKNPPAKNTPEWIKSEQWDYVVMQ